MNPQRIVIIGAALAGATAAVTLRDEGFDGEIQLIGAERQLPYNRPPLSKAYLRGEGRLEDQLVNPPGIYAEKSIQLRLGTRATAIDAKKKHVEVEDGERIAYDRLLVATGGRNRPVSSSAAATTSPNARNAIADGITKKAIWRNPVSSRRRMAS